jgi:hypothetical protein
VLAGGRENDAGPRGPVEGGRGHARDADKAKELFPPPSSPVPSGQGRMKRADDHDASAKPTRKPNPPRGLEAMALANKSLFDTYRVRGGRAIGDLTVSEAREMADTNEKEARVLRAVCNHVAGHVPAGTPLRQAVKRSVLERAIAQSLEVTNVA